MENTVTALKNDFKKLADSERATHLMRFFKTGKGDYGEGDVFLGITVPEQRKVAKNYMNLTLDELAELLASDIHEYRFTALVILVNRFQKADEKGKKEVYDFYYKHRQCVNNWDLVDTSAHKIMGAYLMDKKRDILYKLAQSGALWDKRIAMVSTFMFIYHGQFEDALAIAEILVHDEHDLIQKAVGWMLREVGKRDEEAEKGFLRKYKDTMPRTMWRYATEKGVRV